MSRRAEWILTILSNLCTVIAAAFGVWTYLMTSTGSQLVYAVSPNHTAIADPTRSSKIEVLVNGQKVISRVMAAQVQIFNDGDRWIEPPDFTDDHIQIETEPAIPLIDVAERVTRPKVTGLAVDRSLLARGIVPLTWKLLQKGDGALVTLYYSAHVPEVRFRVAGTLKTQRDLVPVISDPVEKLAEVKRHAPVIIAAAIVAFCLFAGLTYASFNRKRLLQVFFGVAFFLVTATVTWMVVRIAAAPKMPFPL